MSLLGGFFLRICERDDMKWILILFLFNGEEIVYGELESCDVNKIWNKVEMFQHRYSGLGLL